ncbi:MAG: DUF2185 domain-containing protein [Acutalibacteraceae bacterium]|nr:DUF2185 domain-containing protein [Acutalibacteraceae bacterium]
MNKVFNLSQKDDYCIVSKNILKGEKIIDCFYRQRPIEQKDSGWRFCDENNNENDVVLSKIDEILKLDTKINDYINLPPGSILRKINDNYVLINDNTNLNRLVLNIFSKIGKIDYIEKKDYNFGVINSKKIIISVIASEFFEKQFSIKFNKESYNLCLDLINTVCKSGALKDDVLIYEKNGVKNCVIIKKSKNVSWLYEIEQLNKAGNVD